ncbi:MAG: rod shape-determining protein RodA [Cryomorphaceae bacterium]|nr:rod shape-determining protein RodA [Cryomorphaceae bacterium]
MSNRGTFSMDWTLVFMYLALVFIGWLNIYAATYSDAYTGFFDMNQNHGRQLVFIMGALLMIGLILFLDVRLINLIPWPVYLLSLLSLLAVLLFGQKISGARSWFTMGGFAFQPGEFAKVAASLALAKYMSQADFSWKKFKPRLSAIGIIALPALLILPQPDLGSAIVFSAFILVFHREGMSPLWIFLGLALGVLFVFCLLFDPLKLSLAIIGIIGLMMFLQRKIKGRWLTYVGILSGILIFIQTVDFTFDHLLEDRHRNRINILLGLEQDFQGVGYNTHQAQIAIGSGGFWGKGFLQGTQTKFNFVPEQHTDFIFCTVGEEWGFVGSVAVILLFAAFIIRLVMVAERQKIIMYRIYGYAVASILFFHFTINIAMAIGLFPVVGIPLPFISYGGSSLWAFTILLFLFIKMDGHRKEIW